MSLRREIKKELMRRCVDCEEFLIVPFHPARCLKDELNCKKEF